MQLMARVHFCALVMFPWPIRRPRLHSCGHGAVKLRLHSMSIAELRKLPADEKLKIIEILWSDLAADEESLPSPAWHEEELRKTEADLAAGRVDALDWEDAKKKLRKDFE
jgi:putative addiction module component (TIGR02574 family)